MGMLGAGGETVDTPRRRNEPTVTDRPAERYVRDEGPSLGAVTYPSCPLAISAILSR